MAEGAQHSFATFIHVIKSCLHERQGDEKFDPTGSVEGGNDRSGDCDAKSVAGERGDREGGKREPARSGTDND